MNLKSFNPISWFIKTSLVKKVLTLVVVAGIIFAVSKVLTPKADKPVYQTATAEKGTLIVSITGSGTISSGNSTKITTKTSGVVKNVYVKNGDVVTKGQKIAEITPDDYALERQSSAYVAYLDAVQAVKTAQKAKTDADIEMWKGKQAIADSEQQQKDKNNAAPNPTTKKDYTEAEKVVVDKTVDQAHQAFAIAELQYKNADAEISNAQVKVAAAWQDYQEASATILAPVAGIVNNLTLAPGVVIESTTNTNSNNTSNSSGTTVTAQQIGIINNPNGQFQATLNLTESDVTKVKAGQKATLTLDAFQDMTFTGKVLAVDTAGSVSSGVTNYPVIILLDPTNETIYPNMAVEAHIITDVLDNVILVPTTAVITANGQSAVRVMNNDQVNVVTVETGGSNDTQTAITSGINEGDSVVTSVTTPTSGTATQRPSTGSVFGGPFGGGNNRGGAAGRAVMITR